MPSARLASAFAALGVALAAPSADVVKSLPGWDGPLPSKHYSGYLDASETKHLHYYYVEKEGAWKKNKTYWIKRIFSRKTSFI